MTNNSCEGFHHGLRFCYDMSQQYQTHGHFQRTREQMIQITQGLSNWKEQSENMQIHYEVLIIKEMKRKE